MTQVTANIACPNTEIVNWVKGFILFEISSYFTAGFRHKGASMDLNVVRLCFQVFLPDEHGKITRIVPPVVSQPIHDKSKWTLKAPITTAAYNKFFDNLTNLWKKIGMIRWFSWNTMPYLLFLKKLLNLKLSSAANYRWHFMD